MTWIQTVTTNGGPSQLIKDTSLSSGARLLWMMLATLTADEVGTIAQADLASWMGCTEREINAYGGELIRARWAR